MQTFLPSQKMSFYMLLSHAMYRWATPRLVGGETMLLTFWWMILNFKTSGVSANR